VGLKESNSWVLQKTEYRGEWFRLFGCWFHATFPKQDTDLSNRLNVAFER